MALGKDYYRASERLQQVTKRLIQVCAEHNLGLPVPAAIAEGRACDINAMAQEQWAVKQELQRLY